MTEKKNLIIFLNFFKARHRTNYEADRRLFLGLAYIWQEYILVTNGCVGSGWEFEVYLRMVIDKQPYVFTITDYTVLDGGRCVLATDTHSCTHWGMNGQKHKDQKYRK